MLLNGEDVGPGKKIGGKPMVATVIAVLAEKPQGIRPPRVQSLWLQPRPLRKRPSELDVPALTSTCLSPFPSELNQRVFIVWPQKTAQRAIIVAGCLGMIYLQLTTSPATVQFARALGANGLHIGILGSLPTAMLFMQFVSGVLVNRFKYRRRLWLTVGLVQRLVMLPAALGPTLWPDMSDGFWIWTLVGLTAVNYGMADFCHPLWMSWMGDYLPRQGLSRFWGKRHLWMHCSAAAALGCAAVYVSGHPDGIKPAFAMLGVIAAVCGVVDLLLFLKVDEPPVRPAPSPRLRDILSAPFEQREFRRFIGFSCFWHFAAMTGAPFIGLFLLEYVGMDLFHVMLLWATSWIGGALAASRMGWLADKFGHRPLLVLSISFKSALMIALLLVPANPTLAFWLLIPVFMLDALLNAGIAIAQHGFLLSYSPSENRAMYIAAGTAIAGMVGGATSIGSGFLLRSLAGWDFSFLAVGVSHFHVLFSISLLLRLLSSVLVLSVEEPEAARTGVVVTHLWQAAQRRLLRLTRATWRVDVAAKSPRLLAGETALPRRPRTRKVPWRDIVQADDPSHESRTTV
ncbi:MAG: MFS transporter [Planctomycetota bacterium]|nr:MAG: MFS transporter [Planctomycetota bacterium]